MEKGERSLTMDKQSSNKNCENNEIKDKENTSTEAANLNETCSKILGFIKNHFKEISLILPVITIILSSIWKLFQICIQRGRLSIYGLENIGAEFYSKLGELEITESVALAAVFLACNLGSYLILVQNAGLTKVQKGMLTFSLLFLETMPLLILANEGNGVGTFIQSFQGADAYELVTFIITILTYWMTINVIAVLIKIAKFGDFVSTKLKKTLSNQCSHITHKRDLGGKGTTVQDGAVTENSTEEKNLKHKNDKEKEFKVFIGFAIVTLILIMTIDAAAMYTTEGKKEKQRCQFDVITETAAATHQTKFRFENKENGQAFLLFPIIAENDNQYIVSRIYRSDVGEIHIDRNYYRIINKDDVAVYRVSDIYNENYEEFIANII